MLEHLVSEKGIDWSRVTVFHLYEYVGVPITHPVSFRKYLQELDSPLGEGISIASPKCLKLPFAARTENDGFSGRIAQARHAVRIREAGPGAVVNLASEMW